MVSAVMAEPSIRSPPYSTADQREIRAMTS
jgi:hypothetical protein